MRHFSDALFEGLFNESLQEDILALEETDERHLLNINKVKDTNRLFITGLPGCGKTTLAQELADKDAEVVSLDKLDFEYNTTNYGNSEAPQVVKTFLETDTTEDSDTRIENFLSWICSLTLDNLAIIEGMQLLNFKDILEDEAVIVIDLPVEQLIKQIMQRDSWEDTIINDQTAKSEEEFEKLLRQNYKQDQKLVQNFLEKGE